LFPFRVHTNGDRRQALLRFQKQIDIRFHEVDLLDLALRHRSFTNEDTSQRSNNERLEFLGDAVLGMVVAARLYVSLSDHTEGDLAKIKSVVVSEEILSIVALDLGIDKYIMLGKGEELSGGRTKKAILADALESLIGALYLDSGYRSAEQFVLRIIQPQIDLVKANCHQRDFKTMLQEFAQKYWKTVPKYILDRKTGPDHDRTFWVFVEVGGTVYGPESGKNKKEAEQAVAGLAWRKVSQSPE